MPRRWQSWGWIGTLRKADSMSILARKQPWLIFKFFLTASWTFMYVREHNDFDIPSLTLEPAGWERSRMFCKRKELESLIGLLHNASIIVRPGRTFHRRYINFCSHSGLTAYPSSEDTLCKFVGFLGPKKLKHQSIKSYLSGIRYYIIEQSHPDPFLKDMPRLQYVPRGIKSEEAKAQAQTKQRLPVTPALFMKMYSSLQSNPYDFDNMIWSASLVCFFSFMRSGEITIPSQSAYDPSVHLNFADVSVDDLTNPTIIQLSIKQSKTDPFRHGVNMYLGSTGNTLCPVTALLNYFVSERKTSGSSLSLRWSIASDQKQIHSEKSWKKL